jgi:hypothetical protein
MFIYPQNNYKISLYRNEKCNYDAQPKIPAGITRNYTSPSMEFNKNKETR